MPIEQPRLHLNTEPSPEHDREHPRFNPAIARIIASTYMSDVLTHDHVLDTAKTDDVKEHIRTASPDMLSYKAINAVSTDSRKAYWETSPKTFQEQNLEWNTKTWDYLTTLTTDDAPQADVTKAALASLSIDMENTEQSGALYLQLEGFRKTFLGKKSNVESLITKLADDCKDERGVVNLAILEERVDSVKGLFSSFGTTDHIPEILADYASAYGLLTQLPVDKEQIADAVIPLVMEPVTEPEHNYFTILGSKLHAVEALLRDSLNPVARPDRTMVQPQREESTNVSENDDRDYDATREESEGRGRGDGDPTTDENLIDEGPGAGDNDPTTNEALDNDDGGAEEASDDPGGDE